MSTIGDLVQATLNPAEQMGTSLAGPVDSFVIEGVRGQVPAFGELTLTDTASEDSHFVEVGVQHDVDPDDLEPVLLDMSDLTAHAASSATRSGSYSTNVLRGTLGPAPVALCSTGSLPHKGLWKPRVRVYGSDDFRVRLQWRTGGGGWTNERWVRVGPSDWRDVDLGTIDIRELPEGHSWEGRIVGVSDGEFPTLDVDTVSLLPCDRYFVGRGTTSPSPSSAIVAADDFVSHDSGSNLTGLTAPVGGNWSGSGDSDDFTVGYAFAAAGRAAISDSNLNSGRYCRLGSGTLTDATIDFNINASLLAPLNSAMGVFARYADTNNWVMVRYVTPTTVLVEKRVSGTVSTLAVVSTGGVGSHRFTVGADGTFALVRGTTWLAIGQDSDLATGGALASGGYGIYHANTSANPAPGFILDFSVSGVGLVSLPALCADDDLTLLHNDALTGTPDGTGRTPVREGNYLTLPPATRAGLKSRVVVRRRTHDLAAGLPDTGLDATTDALLSVTERVTLGKNNG